MSHHDNYCIVIKPDMPLERALKLDKKKFTRDVFRSLKRKRYVVKHSQVIYGNRRRTERRSENTTQEKP